MKLSSPTTKHTQLQILLLVALMANLLSLVFHVVNPSESENVWLLGYSPLRLAIIVAIMLLSMLNLLAIREIRQSPDWSEKVALFLHDRTAFLLSLVVTGLMVLVGLVFFFFPTFDLFDFLYDYHHLYFAAVPTMGWLLIIGCIAAGLIFLLRSIIQKTQGDAPNEIRRPILIYLGVLFIMVYLSSLVAGWLHAKGFFAPF